jgi:GGDEF domain-containing protein
MIGPTVVRVQPNMPGSRHAQTRRIERFCLRPGIGIAICPRNGANTETLLTNAVTLLTNAELAMYRAKPYDTGHGFAD